MEAGANQRKPSRHGQARGTGQTDGPGPRKPAAQGGNVSDPAEAGGVELALALNLLHLPEWLKKVATWETDTNGDRNIFYVGIPNPVLTGAYFSLGWTLWENRNSIELLRSRIGDWIKKTTSEFIICRSEDHRDVRGDLIVLSDASKKVLEAIKKLSPLAHSLHGWELREAWGLGYSDQLITVSGSVEWFDNWVKACQKAIPPEPCGKGKPPNPRGKVHEGAPKKAETAEFQFLIHLADLFNRFVAYPTSATPGFVAEGGGKRKHSAFTRFIESVLTYARRLDGGNNLPSEATLRRDYLPSVLAGYRTHINQANRGNLEALTALEKTSRPGRRKLKQVG